jgi:poly-gamma-glutamate synthesis protein (capsule biosynthesis protein)
MDFSYGGLEKTLFYAKKTGIVHSGVGKNLAEASAPCYIDTENGRVALISVSTSFDPSMMAGEQSVRYPGRPGVNGIRHTKTITVPRADYDRLCEIAEATRINAYSAYIRAQGYGKAPDEGILEFGSLRFVAGKTYETKCQADQRDLARLKQSIEEAKFQADYVIVSVHSHNVIGDDPEEPADFYVDLAHACVDCGADAVIGHGCHQLRPIEVYRERPIFYSLGDFVIQLYSLPSAPADFFAQQGLSGGDAVATLLKKRTKDCTCGLMEDRKMLQSVIPYWEMDGDRLRSLSLLPVEMMKGEGKHLEGLPRIAKDISFIEHLAEISKPYGVNIEWKDGIAVCTW